MQELINSYLVQSKECSLPGIGDFKIISHPAKYDTVDKMMHPPTSEIIFTSGESTIDENLIQYISGKENVGLQTAQNHLKEWCNNAFTKLSNGETIHFIALGNLRNNEAGKTFFIPAETPHFYKPVIAKRVVHENTNHKVLVGDTEISSGEKAVNLPEEKSSKSWWKIAALVLGFIAICIILFQYYNHGLSFGNQSKINPKAPAETYSK